MALVVDADGRLEATITDGDVRRAILLGIELDQPISDLFAVRTENGRNGRPVTAPLGTAPEELCQIMAEYRVRGR